MMVLCQGRETAKNNIKLLAFSLVELSIVLVILGLLVGGVLTARSMIDAARLKSQIVQLDEYKTAINSFNDKYQYLPGDIPNAANFGMHARNGCNKGYGDGDGMIYGVNNVNTPSCTSGNEGGGYLSTGELLLMWQDLTISGLITSTIVKTPDAIFHNPSTNPNDCFPPAKLGNGNYIYASSNGPTGFGTNFAGNITDGRLYLGIGPIPYCTSGGSATGVTGTAMTVQQAYNMDKKLDDGLPQSGSVMAFRASVAGAGAHMTWAAGGGLEGASGQTCCAGSASYRAPTTAATPYATTNCYDNGNVAGPQTYSMQNADTLNCAVSVAVQ